MAIFERKVGLNGTIMCLDETKPILFDFKEALETNGHIEYSIKVWRDPDPENSWIVKHRYSDFVKLHNSLTSPTIKLPPLPPKKMFANKVKEFIDDRKASLQEYLKKIFEIPYVPLSLQAKRFIDPDNYEGNYLEEARENLLIVLRSGGSHEITQAIPSLGTRIKKYNFIGFPFSDPKSSHLLWWAKYGPDRAVHLRDIHAALTALLHCQHLYIVPAVVSVATESGVCVIKPWFEQGSLRDYIYGVKPQFEAVLKYTNNKRREIPFTTCAVYGRQILEGLAFLHEKGIAHGSVHTGNVVIDNNVCKLLDIENQILGLPHLLRPYMTKIKKINSMEAIDIYCFGHLLYEMVFHDPLESEFCENFPKDCDPLCRSVLESILSSEACRNGLPNAAGLLTHPFFNQVPLISYAKPSLKISSGVRQTFNATYESILKRLKEDQKKIRLKKLKLKADAVLSEEPIRIKQIKKSPKSVLSTSDSSTGNSVKSPSISDSVSVSGSATMLLNEEPTENDVLPPEVEEAPEPVTNAHSSTKEIPSLSRNDLLSSIANFDKKILRRRKQK